jgi:hypothetical protein
MERGYTMTRKDRFELFKQDLDSRLQKYLHHLRISSDYDQFVNEVHDDHTQEFGVGAGAHSVENESDMEVFEIFHADSKPISFEEDWRYWKELEKGKKPPSDSQ